MQLYANPNRLDHAENNAAFLRIVNRFPDLNLYQPSPEKAPWHWQAVIEGADPQLLNFWPHSLKGQRDGMRAVEGGAAIIGIIEGALSDALKEPFDLIEE